MDVSSAVHAKAGLSRYADSLARALWPLLGAELALFQNSLGRRGPLAGFEDCPTAGVPWGYRPWRGLVAARQMLHWPMDGLLPGATLFHATEHLLPPLRVPTVLTVHDLIYERYPQHHKRKNYWYLRATMPLYCRRASALIAISEATRADLAHYYGIDPARVAVIPEAAAPQFRPQPPEQIAAVRRRYKLPGRYLLAVGTIEPRKNLGRLVDACGPLFAAGLAEGLVLVGGKGWLTEPFFAHLAQVPWRERVIVADEDLPAVYAGAVCTVQPSLFEGFGLPVLEAMACGSPVCASAAGSLPEVGGDAASYFDPEDVSAITAALRAVLEDDLLRARLAARGVARAAAYSWARTAQETVAVYRRAIAGA